MKRFWMRRVLRIFPLYYGALAVGAAVCLAIGAEAPSAAYWLYVQNYALAFDSFEVIRWTSHFWSLAVEEQFYFVWPVFMLVLPRSRRIPFTLGALVFGLLLRTYFVFRMPLGPQVSAKMAYVAMPMHMDGLLMGALVAQVTEDPSHALGRILRRIRRPVLVASALFVAALIVWTKGLTPYDRRVAVLGFPALGLCFSMLVLECVERARTRPWRPGSVTRAVERCGQVSYGMYVLHWPIVVALIAPIESLGESYGPWVVAAVTALLIVAGTALSYFAATLSYRYFEAPFLRLKHKFEG
jgi:peptidoglycan/LPS O-acetylase OafA/YrhL